VLQYLLLPGYDSTSIYRRLRAGRIHRIHFELSTMKNKANIFWKDYTICTAAKTYEIGQNRLKLAE